ncbi:TetR/AcrR family transcriptional regulator C-terminal domain-containing protein [Micromonospora sp. NPDC049559]|uniref:TetR/AcrR family transcriptional regulator n=1 Tax=Micromonospora sp. NPDC049559 TaxID=3155923 RepID=UPI003434F1F9
MPRQRPLTPAVIAAAALRVGDREGDRAMTMRRIAAELDCDPMALYRHFPDRQALLDAVADLALADAPGPDPEADWETRLRAVMAAIRSAALAHPGIAAHIAARPPLGEHGRRLGTAMLAALAEAGLSPADVVRASQTLVAYLAAALAMAVRAGERDDRWRHVAETLAAPPVGAAGEELFATGSAEQFAYGLRLLLAGIRAEAAGQTG